jgi:hypothetical protein
MATVYRDGFWRDSVTGDPIAFAPPAIQLSGSLWVEASEVTPIGGAVYVLNAALKAREDTLAMTWVGVKSAAPAASAVQADTGALAAGDYDFDVSLCASDSVAVGKGLVLEHRNAANNATVVNLGGIPAGGSERITLRRYTIATNERLRVIAGTAAGAASSMYVSAIGRRVS